MSGAVQPTSGVGRPPRNELDQPVTLLVERRVAQPTLYRKPPIDLPGPFERSVKPGCQPNSARGSTTDVLSNGRRPLQTYSAPQRSERP